MNREFFRKFKPNKTWVALGAALGIGLLAALAARSYLSSQMAAIEARAKGNKINLVVASRDLKRGEKISSDTVAVRAIPADWAHSGAVAPAEFDRLDGQRLAYAVKSGEMILWSLTEGKKVPSFSTRIEPGRRAITVPVDEINSISGMLEPGDIVDLLVTIDQNSKKATFVLLQSIPVLATGQRASDDSKSGERRQYSTVTLDTTPEQAQNIIVAREAGKITALLRNPQDTQPFGNGSTDIAALFGQRRTAAADSSQQVPVLYGGRGGKLPAEGLHLGQFGVASVTATTDTAPDADQTGTRARRPLDPGVLPDVPVLGIANTR